MKRVFSLLLGCLLALQCLSAGAAANLNPDPSWWGMSRSAFKSAFSNYPFEEIDAGDQKALVLKGGTAGEYTLDMYFCFGEKPAGKSYYGLSDVVYLIPVENGKLSNNALKKAVQGLTEIVAETNGQPDRSTSTSAAWDRAEGSISIEIGSFKDFNGSDERTVAVIFSMPGQEETAAATATPKATAKPKATATPKASAGSGKETGMTLSVSASCSDYNHVGEKWTQVYSVNGKRVTDGKTVALRAGDEITVSAKITEGDSNPDEGTNEKTYVVTKDDLAKGFRITFNVTVEENGGRYKGSKATWRVTFSFKP